MWVEGYAAIFNSPTVLYEIGGNEYREQIDQGAFSEARMDDVIFNYNHGGRVVARTRNQTLHINIDEKGLFVRARLDGTEEGQRLYNEIKGGYVDRMSFAFSVQDDEYDRKTRTRTIRKIKRLYDVSAVDIPAYDDTSIAARRFASLEEEEKKEAKRRKKMILQTFI